MKILVYSFKDQIFSKKKNCKQKKKEVKILRRDLNMLSWALELNALPTWPLHHIGILENYKTFRTNLSKKFLAAILT